MQEHSLRSRAKPRASTLRRSRSAIGMAALALSVCLSTAADSSAQATDIAGETAPAPSGYLEAIEAALYAHERGQYQEARVHFRRAHELYPNARTWRGLGKVEFELRNYGEAKQHLQAALLSTVKPLDSALQAETQALLRRAEAFVGELRLQIEPESALLAVDGIPTAHTARGTLTLMAGDHTLELRAEGRLAERRTLHVRGGEQMSLSIVLSPAPADLVTGAAALRSSAEPRASTAAAPVTDLRRDERAPLYKKWWLWTAVGVVAVGAAVGIALATRDEPPQMVSGGTTGVVLGP